MAVDAYPQRLCKATTCVCLTTLADTSLASLLIVTRQTGVGKCSDQGKQEKWERFFTCKIK